MSKVCSVCLLLSPSNLNPLFFYDGKTWQDTGLSKMFELNNKAKILRDNQSKLFICNDCVKKTVEIYFNNDDQQENINNLTFNETKQLSITPQSCEEQESNPRKKMKLFHHDDDGILRFAEPLKIDLINSLDYDCLARIFSYLPPPQIVKMTEVCTKWRDASALAWYDIKKFNDYDNKEELKTPKDVENILLLCGNYLTDLVLGDLCDSSIMSVVKDNCPNLVKINLNFSCTRIIDFVDVFSRMNKLKKINIAIELCCENNGEDEFPTSVNHAEILHSLPEGVEQIHLSGPYENDDNPPIMNNLSLALERFNNLSHLTLCCYKIDGFASLSQIKTLVSLDFEFCHFTPRTVLISNLPNLEQLNFHCNDDINEFFISAVNQCTNLKHLDMQQFYSNSQLAFQLIGNFANLEYLSLSDSDIVDDDVISGITRGCKKLKTLNLNQCRNVSPHSLQLLKNLTCLESLDLAHTTTDGDVICSIVEKCQKLKILRLNSCENIPSTALRKLGNLKNLKDLSLDFTKNIDDSVITSLAKNCKKLASLSIRTGYKWSVCDNSIKELIINCRFLEYLSISGTNISLGTLIYAAYQKNHDHNNVVLTIVTFNDGLLEWFRNSKIQSPFLKVI